MSVTTKPQGPVASVMRQQRLLGDRVNQQHEARLRYRKRLRIRLRRQPQLEVTRELR